MSLKNTDVRTPGIAAIAKKWNLPVAHIAKLVEIGAKTEHEHNKNISKARQVARDHIAERPDYYQKLKKMEKSPVSVKEENSISAVRGLGYVSGDPAVDPISQYIDTNAMAYQDQNGNVLKLIKKNGKVNSLGFTSYNPTQDHGDVKRRILGRKIMKESKLNELSGGDSRDYEGGVSGLPKSAYRWNDIKEGNRLDKAKKIAGKATRGAVVAANLFTLGQVAGDAAEGRGSPKRSVIAAATAKSGIPGLAATGAHYGLKVKDFMRRKKLEEIKTQIDELHKLTPERLGRYISRSAGQREKALKGPKADVETWERKHHFIQSAFKKLTTPKLDEYANTQSNDYTKPYFTESLERSTRTSHVHIRKPDQVEEPPGTRDSVSPNGEK